MKTNFLSEAKATMRYHREKIAEYAVLLPQQSSKAAVDECTGCIAYHQLELRRLSRAISRRARR